MVAKGIPQTLLLDDEQKNILESRENTSLSPLSLFRVGILCRTLLDSIVIKSGLLKQHRLRVFPLSTHDVVFKSLNDEDKIRYLLTLENETTSKIVGKYTYLMFQKRKD